MTRVIPVITPTIDWPAFVSGVHSALRRSPTAMLDMAGVPPGTLKTFIAALGEFQQPGTNPNTYPQSRLAELALDQISFTFLIVTDPASLVEFLSCGKLNILTASTSRGESVLLANATLGQWLSIMLRGSQLDSDPRLRSVFNELARYFAKQGLGILFSHVEARDMRDGTFALVKNGKD